MHLLDFAPAQGLGDAALQCKVLDYMARGKKDGVIHSGYPPAMVIA